MTTLEDYIHTVEGYEIQKRDPRGFTKSGRVVVSFSCARCGKQTERSLHDVRSTLRRTGALPLYCSRECAVEHRREGKHEQNLLEKEQVKKILSQSEYIDKYRSVVRCLAIDQLKENQTTVEKKRITDHLLQVDPAMSKIMAGRITIAVLLEMGMERRDHDGKRYWFDPRHN